MSNKNKVAMLGLTAMMAATTVSGSLTGVFADEVNNQPAVVRPNEVVKTNKESIAKIDELVKKANEGTYADWMAKVKEFANTNEKFAELKKVVADNEAKPEAEAKPLFLQGLNTLKDKLIAEDKEIAERAKEEARNLPVDKETANAVDRAGENIANEGEVNIEKIVSQFKADHSAILNKPLNTIAATDIDAITKALDAYGKLPEKAQEKLKDSKRLLEEQAKKANSLMDLDKAVNAFKEKYKAILEKKDLKIEDKKDVEAAIAAFNTLTPEQQVHAKAVKKTLDDELGTIAKLEREALEASVNKYKEDNKAILSTKDTDLKLTDEEALNKAENEYTALSKEAQAKLKTEKAQLEALRTKMNELKGIDKAVKDFKEKYKAILEKAKDKLSKEDLAIINEAKAEYEKQSNEVKAALKDDLNKLKDDERTINNLPEAVTDEDTKAADAFKTKYADLLAMDRDKVTESDKENINKALAEYDTLSPKVQNLLKNEKIKLDSLKKATITKATPETGNATTLFASIAGIGSTLTGAGAYLFKRRFTK